MDLPEDDADRLQSDRYLQSWDAIGALLDVGRSWSGRERNGCFLNTRDGKFATVPGLFGLDQADDSRAVALGDWDRDGDLDIWMSNRTGPRVRFLRNELSTSNRFIAFRLEGSDSNRDAIGARVDVEFEGAATASQFRTLRAGEGYLSQSSKWIHFGVPAEQVPSRVTVRWPNGGVETFADLGVSQRFHLLEGSGQAMPVILPSAEAVSAGEWEPEQTEAFRIVPHNRLPLPPLDFLGIDGQETRLADTLRAKPRLLTIWASWCVPCVSELKELQAHDAELQGAGIDIFPLNGEDLEKPPTERIEAVDRFFRKNRLSPQGGLAIGRTIEILDAVQRSVVGYQRPLPVPISFLLDSSGRVAVIYKGRFSVPQLLRDVREIQTPTKSPRDFAVPFAGRWYVNAFPADVLGLPEKLLDRGLLDPALDYLLSHVTAPTAGRPMPFEWDRRKEEIIRLYRRVGTGLLDQNNYSRAVAAIHGALSFEPSADDLRVRLAIASEQTGDLKTAVATYRDLLRRHPEEVPVLNSLAWILATAKDESLSDPVDAIRLATLACDVSQNSLPETMDTLAAAYAAGGRFEEAVATANQALALARSKGNESLEKTLVTRLERYQRGEPVGD